MTERPLFIPLKREYYEAFVSGEKGEEYRLYGKRWNEKTCRVGRAVTLSLGYGKAHRTAGTIAGFTALPMGGACRMDAGGYPALLRRHPGIAANRLYHHPSREADMTDKEAMDKIQEACMVATLAEPVSKSLGPKHERELHEAFSSAVKTILKLTGREG